VAAGEIGIDDARHRRIEVVCSSALRTTNGQVTPIARRRR
jgi:hypothetical protein